MKQRTLRDIPGLRHFCSLPFSLLPFFLLPLFFVVPRPLHAEQVCYDHGILVDNGDPEYSDGGTWDVVTDSYYTAGQSWTDSRKTSEDGAWAKWIPNLPVAGRYRVYLWHIPSRGAGATIEIAHNGKLDTVARDMTYGHLGWTNLGDYDFAAGSAGYVKATRTIGTLIVDSVKLVPIQDVSTPKLLDPYPRADGSLPRLDAKGNLILSGKPYQVLYQELMEDTVAAPGAIPTIDETFETALAQRVNTLGVTLYWKAFETSEGVYDYRVIDALIEKARARNMHLSLILFWGWRNLQSYYVPRYIYDEKQKYPPIQFAPGSKQNNYVLSPFGQETLAAESRSLCALLARVKEKDPTHQIVVLAQLENEMPAFRDYSEAAMKAWNGDVPPDLTAYLSKHEQDISPWIRGIWDRHGSKTSGTWADVFGDDNNGSKVFAVWSQARYIQSLVSAAKNVLDIPFYCNAWIWESPCYSAFSDVFHAAAPGIDGMGPDAYGPKSRWEKETALAVRDWNHLVIPEQHYSAQTTWRAIGKYNAMLSGEYYDVEGLDWLRSKETYDLVNEMMQPICEKKGTGDMLGFFQDQQKAGESWDEFFKEFRIRYIATVNPRTWWQFSKEHPAPCEQINNVTGGELDGCGLIMKVGDNEYVVTSTRVDLEWSYPGGGKIGVARAKTGHYQQGRWIRDGGATVDQTAESIRFHFPTANRQYGQIRFKLSTRPSHPVTVYEMEDGKMIGEAAVDADITASNSLFVGGLSRFGCAVEIRTRSAAAAHELTIGYSAQHACKLSLYVNDVRVQDLQFPATGDWSVWNTKTVDADVPAGAAVKLQVDNGDDGPRLDYLMIPGV